MKSFLNFLNFLNEAEFDAAKAMTAFKAIEHLNQKIADRVIPQEITSLVGKKMVFVDNKIKINIYKGPEAERFFANRKPPLIYSGGRWVTSSPDAFEIMHDNERCFWDVKANKIYIQQDQLYTDIFKQLIDAAKRADYIYWGDVDVFFDSVFFDIYGFSKNEIEPIFDFIESFN